LSLKAKLNEFRAALVDLAKHLGGGEEQEEAQASW
jgi:hypothetical protein